MAVYGIPLSPSPQKFAISLAGTTYNLRFQWNDAPTGGWVLDISDENDNLIIGGIPLVTGADLLEQYDYLALGGGLEVQTTYDLTAVPTFENLGITANLYFVTTDA